MKIAIIMTCFNRASLTQKCIESLMKEARIGDIHFFVVEDGCTDDTVVVLQKYGSVITILHGNGELYWNRGMHYAFSEAVKTREYDYYLWVNDDVEFIGGFLEKMLSFVNEKGNEIILAGYVCDPKTKEVTYGGVRDYSKIIPLNLKMVLPSKEYLKCDTMHGNCVLITNKVVNWIGLNDKTYSHGFGDVDYGLTATKSGIGVYLTPYCVGYCSLNRRMDRVSEFRTKSLRERFALMNSIQHRPVKDWYYYTRKQGGNLWFLRFIGPYIKLFFNKY